MDTIKIGTSQNVDIEQPIASIGERIVATMVDLAVISIYSIGILYFGGIVMKSKSILTLGMVPVIFYGLISEVVMDGQTLGKKLVKIKVIQMDGTSVPFLSYFLRWAVGLVELFISCGTIALITIISNRKGQRLGDMAANTAMVRIPKNSLTKPLCFQVPENYSVVFTKAINLSVHDINTIGEVLELINSEGSNPQAAMIAKKAREAICKKLNIESKLPNIGFFQTLLYDYHSLQMEQQRSGERSFFEVAGHI